MEIPLDEVVYFDVVTSSATTGAATDADSTPTFEVFEEATDTDIGVGGNLTKRTSKTGNYRGTFTASAANGFEVGKWYNIVASATVGGIAGKAVVKTFRLVAIPGSANGPMINGANTGTPTWTGGLSVLLANGAHGGAAATLTLKNAAFNNADGAGISITAAGNGIDITADGNAIYAYSENNEGVWFESANSAGLEITGGDYGLWIGANAGAAVQLNSGTVGFLVVGSPLFPNNIITANQLADGAITAAKLATDSITAAKVHSDVTTELQSGLATAAVLATVAGYIDTEVAAIKAKTDQLTFTVANKVDSTPTHAALTSLASMIAANKFTAEALENVPTGEGGGFEDEDRNKLSAIFNLVQ